MGGDVLWARTAAWGCCEINLHSTGHRFTMEKPQLRRGWEMKSTCLEGSRCDEVRDGWCGEMDSEVNSKKLCAKQGARVTWNWKIQPRSSLAFLLCSKFHSSILSVFLANLGTHRSPFFKNIVSQEFRLSLSCFFGKVPQHIYHLPTHQYHKSIYFSTAVWMSQNDVTATAPSCSSKYP